MSLVLAALLGAGIALGLLLVAAGLTGRTVLPRRRRSPTNAGQGGGRRLALGSGAAAAGLLAATVTRWPVCGLLTAGLVLAAPTLLGGRHSRQDWLVRTEAIASWTEMIRDAIGAASGLEEAIVATGPIAPAPIRREVSLLMSRLRHGSLPDALTAFGADVRHPSADLVVAALTIAARMEASDLTGLLSRLAESIRGEARMRLRVEVGRTQVRTATKVIVGVVLATAVLLTTLSRSYLHPYDSPLGQAVLLVVAAIFATGGWLLVRMATIELPDRFTARTGTGSQ